MAPLAHRFSALLLVGAAARRIVDPKREDRHGEVEELMNYMRSVPTIPLDHSNAALVAQGVEQDDDDDDDGPPANVTAADLAPEGLCAFSQGPPALQPWAAPITKRFDAFLNDIGQAGIVVTLMDGSLLGSYRHHGTIPHDEDMDVIFNLCLNQKLLAQTRSFKNKTCGQLRRMLKRPRGMSLNARKLWWEVMHPRFFRQGGRYTHDGPDGRTIRFVKPTSYGMRLSNGDGSWSGGLEKGRRARGVGMDVKVIAEPPEPYCRCAFGTAEPVYCAVDSKALLLKQYGSDFMIPKSQCDYYADLGHKDWNYRSRKECDWVKTAFEQEYQSSMRELSLEQAALKGAGK